MAWAFRGSSPAPASGIALSMGTQVPVSHRVTAFFGRLQRKSFPLEDILWMKLLQGWDDDGDTRNPGTRGHISVSDGLNPERNPGTQLTPLDSSGIHGSNRRCCLQTPRVFQGTKEKGELLKNSDGGGLKTISWNFLVVLQLPEGCPAAGGVAGPFIRGGRGCG